VPFQNETAGAQAQAGPTPTFSGRVVSIADGDTITVLRGREQIRVRLHGIDCPERQQAFGTRARQFTGELAAGKTVTVRVTDTDRHGRTVGEVILPDGRNLNHELVKAGLACWYRKYAPGDRVPETLEEEARKEALRLRSEATPVPPLVWRKQDHVRNRADRRRSAPRSLSRNHGRWRR
jgi:endonuclease YncB( thermonuclease family)